MEARVGRDVLDALDASAGPYKWTREELEGLRSYYRKKLADIAAGIDPRQTDITSVIDLFKDQNT
jgi:hypothetical protein